MSKRSLALAFATLGLCLIGNISADVTRPSESSFGPPTRVVSVYVTQAQVLALNTTPITILPLETGYFHIPFKAHVSREAGTAYITATAFVLRTTNGSGAIQCHSFDSGIYGTGPVTYILSCPSSNGTGMNGSEPESRAATNIVAHAVTGNPASGTGGFYVTLWYHRFPVGRL